MMIRSELVFRVAVNEGCPYYRKGDEFRVSGNALLLDLCQEKTFVTTAVVKPPSDRNACRVIIADLTRVLIENQRVDRIPHLRMECSGCSGKVGILPVLEPIPAAQPKSLRTRNIHQAAELLSKFSIFQSLDPDHLSGIISLLKLRKYSPGTVILEKGTPARNLYILVTGAVDVLDEYGTRLSTLRNGDVFGEMSLISGEPVAATVKVVEPASMLMIRGENFKQLLHQFPSIQMYLVRLLARRLAQSNLAVAEEIATSMNGNLREISPVEVIQTLHMNQKTGTLTLNVENQKVEIIFRKGELIWAKFDQQRGREAIYALLGQKSGRFRFQPRIDSRFQEKKPIGPFMEILLSGLKHMDDEPPAAAAASG
jgi:CRP-like cAMP-binding protein